MRRHVANGFFTGMFSSRFSCQGLLQRHDQVGGKAGVFHPAIGFVIAIYLQHRDAGKLPLRPGHRLVPLVDITGQHHDIGFADGGVIDRGAVTPDIWWTLTVKIGVPAMRATIMAALQIRAIAPLSLCLFVRTLPCPDASGTCLSLSISLLESTRCRSDRICRRMVYGRVAGFIL